MYAHTHAHRWLHCTNVYFIQDKKKKVLLPYILILSLSLPPPPSLSL